MGTFHRDAGHGTLRIETDLWSETFGDDAPGGDPADECVRGAARRHRAAQRRPDRGVRAGTAPPHPEIVVMPIFVPRPEDFDG